MSKLYKLTQDTISVIRTDAEGVKQAEDAGFVLEGECDESYVVINPGARPVKAEKPKTEKPDADKKAEDKGPDPKPDADKKD